MMQAYVQNLVKIRPSDVGAIALMRFTEFKVISTKLISFHAYRHNSTSSCRKFGENPLSGVGVDVLVKHGLENSKV